MRFAAFFGETSSPKRSDALGAFRANLFPFEWVIQRQGFRLWQGIPFPMLCIP